jgi:hypothetical protein
MGGIDTLEVVEEALAGFVETLHTPDTYVQSVESLRAALALVRKMRADAVVGWVNPGCAARWRSGDDWCVVIGDDSTREGWDRPALLLLPDSTEPNDED